MTDFLLNECGDLDYTNGRLTIVTGVDAIRQRWLIYIRTYLDEWFLDRTIGVPYFQRVLKKAVSRDVLKQVFRDATLAVPGVLQVTSVVVDSLIVATRQAEVTVTCIVTGAEGPETGVFRYTGEIPPGGCDIITSVPETISDQWYWFDPSDLGTVEGSGGSKYAPGSPFVLSNKFAQQQGNILVHALDGSGAAEPTILPVINGRKAVEGQTSTDPQLLCGFGVAGAEAEVRALRASTGHSGDFTVFGVYQPLVAPGAGVFAPLMCFNGVDPPIAGSSQRVLNLLMGGGTGLQLRFQQTLIGGAVQSIDSSVSGVLPTDAWVFALVYGPAAGGLKVVRLWINNTQVLNAAVGIPAVEQTGELAWNDNIDGTSGALSEVLLRANFGDMIGYSRALTAAEIDRVFVYLLNKWGI